MFHFSQPADLEELILDPKDDKLLEEDLGGAANDIRRSQRHATFISWMRRPDYISTEQTRYQPTTMEKVESKIGYVVRKKMGAEQVGPQTSFQVPKASSCKPVFDFSAWAKSFARGVSGGCSSRKENNTKSLCSVVKYFAHCKNPFCP